MREYTTLGRLVRQTREARGLSRPELARRMGWNVAYPGYVERGQRRPKPQGLAHLARVLDVDYLALARAAGYAPQPIGELTVTVETVEQAAWLRQFAARFTADDLERLYSFAVEWLPGAVAEPEAHSAGRQSA